MPSTIDAFSMAAPDDVQEIGLVFGRLAGLQPRCVAVLGKVEGTATTNDFSRGLARRAIRDAAADAGLDLGRLQIVLSTGCEGVISPGGTVLAACDAGPDVEGDLRVGFGASRALEPAEIVAQAHVDHAREAVLRALDSAGLDPRDPVLVLLKSPLLTHPEAVGLPAGQARFAGVSGAARGAAALGLGAALGEIAPGDAAIENLLVRPDLYSRRGMVFSGTETRACEAIVIGQPAGATSGPRLRCGLVEDLVDIEGMARIVNAGESASIDAARVQARDLCAVFFKAGVARDGLVRGRRTTVFSSDLDPDKHMRAAASGALAALVGDCRMFVSGGAEHQAPDGGCVFAVISRS